MTTHEIAECVERSLRAHRAELGKATYKAVESGIRQEDDYWYVPVEASKTPPNTARYFEILADIETDLLDKSDLNVLIFPAESPAAKNAGRPLRAR